MDKVERAVIDLDGEWPDMSLGEDVLYFHALTKNYQALIGEIGPYGGEFVCTYSEFMETRKRLENKPGWDDHDWPQICFFNSYWWVVKAGWSLKDNISDEWKGRAASILTGDGERLCRGRYFGDWEQSLERRPESKTNQEAKPESVEWVPGLELPPINEQCRALLDDGVRWVDCFVLAHTDFEGERVAVFKHADGVDWGIPQGFGPIQSHRDKVIEAVAGKLGDLCPLPEVLNAIYDIGALKLPEDQE